MRHIPTQTDTMNILRGAGADTLNTPPLSVSRPPTPPPVNGRSVSCGSLRLLVGPMFSGKSTELLHTINSYRAIGKTVLVITPRANTRCRGESLTTHDTHDTRDTRDTQTPPPSRTTPTGPRRWSLGGAWFARSAPEASSPNSALRVDPSASVHLSRTLTEWTRPVHPLLAAADVVCIEEMQFFADGLAGVLHMVEELHKDVVCAGLIADYQRRPFGDMLALIPHADNITHTKALCGVCNDGTVGLFTKRLSGDTDQVVVGAKDKYQVVCRRHYMETSGTAACVPVVGQSSPATQLQATPLAAPTPVDGAPPTSQAPPIAEPPSTYESFVQSVITNCDYVVGYSLEDPRASDNDDTTADTHRRGTDECVPWYVDDLPDHHSEDAMMYHDGT